MKKRTILFGAFLTWTLFSIVMILGVWVKPLGQALLYRYDGCRGDLYAATYIRHFEDPQPCGTDEPNAPGARLIVVGDSFFTSTWQGEPFIRMLGRKLGEPVWTIPDYDEGPLPYLAANLDRLDRRPRLLILGRVERSTLSYFSRFTTELPREDVVPKLASATLPVARNDSAVATSVTGPSRLSIFLASFLDKAWRFRLLHLGVEPEKRDHLVLNNFLIHPFYRLAQTLRFRLTRKISSEVVYERYSLSPPFLFFRGAVDFNQRAKSDEALQQASAAVARFRRTLKEVFNMELIVLTIPNKYSLYGDLAEKDYRYDNYLPNLTQKLREAGIAAPDLYSRFALHRKLHPGQWLYYPSDTHWNGKGKELAVDEVLQALTLLEAGAPAYTSLHAKDKPCAPPQRDLARSCRPCEGASCPRPSKQATE